MPHDSPKDYDPQRDNKRGQRCEDESPTKHSFEQLSAALFSLSRELGRATCQLESHNNNQAILDRIAEMEQNIMQSITDYAVRVNTVFDTISASVDEIATSQTGIAKDIQGLKDLIAKLQASPDGWTPADQATLDAIEARANSLVTKTAAVSAALKTLDEQTEEVPPVEPPAE